LVASKYKAAKGNESVFRKNGCYYFGERVIIIFVFLLRWDTEGF
jgi:hypothetical protein